MKTWKPPRRPKRLLPTKPPKKHCGVSYLKRLFACKVISLEEFKRRLKKL